MLKSITQNPAQKNKDDNGIVAVNCRSQCNRSNDLFNKCLKPSGIYFEELNKTVIDEKVAIYLNEHTILLFRCRHI